MRQIRVVAALLFRGDTILVQQRLPNKSLGLLWEFPGGKVEAGESDPEALRRECREELGVEIEVQAKVWEARHEYPDLTVELHLFRASLAADATPQPLEANQIAWVHRTKLGELPFCEADRALLPLLASGEVG